MNLEIINKEDVPAGRIRWQRLLNNLAYDKAIKLVFISEAKVEKQRNNVITAFRKTGVSKQDFYIETQVTQLEDNQWALFIWKEEKGDVTNL